MISNLAKLNLLRQVPLRSQFVSTATASTINSSPKVDFESISAAYGYKSKSEIFRGWLVFKLCSYNSLVDHLGQTLTTVRAIIGQNMFQKIMKSTIYGHFAAGIDRYELQPMVERLQKHGVKLILDYCMESDIGNNQLHHSASSTSGLHNGNFYDDNTMKSIANVQTAASLCGSSATTAIKVTAFVGPDILQKLNTIIEKEQPSRNISIMDFVSKNSTLLKEQERKEIELLVQRINHIIREVETTKGKIFIDAEQSYFQTAIHKLVLEMQKKYNQDRLIVYNTYQCYRKSTLSLLKEDLIQSKTDNFYIGFKLVRGAYMDQERKLALDNNTEDPIHPSFAATTECYHRAVVDVLQHAKTYKNLHFLIASHNEDTVKYVVRTMSSMNVKPNDGIISFATLLGMCDYLTFPLAAVGYDAYKLAPYGPVNRLLPYLTRRAQENRAIFAKAEKDRRLHLRALKQRM